MKENIVFALGAVAMLRQPEHHNFAIFWPPLNEHKQETVRRITYALGAYIMFQSLSCIYHPPCATCLPPPIPSPFISPSQAANLADRHSFHPENDQITLLPCELPEPPSLLADVATFLAAHHAYRASFKNAMIEWRTSASRSRTTVSSLCEHARPSPAVLAYLDGLSMTADLARDCYIVKGIVMEARRVRAQKEAKEKEERERRELAAWSNSSRTQVQVPQPRMGGQGEGEEGCSCGCSEEDQNGGSTGEEGEEGEGEEGGGGECRPTAER